MQGFFYCLKINKMESKNDWYLNECKREIYNNKYYYSCTYSNGLTEKKIYISIGQELPTIMPNERLLSGLKNSENMRLSVYNALQNSK